jgi:cytosine/adenosine deaminase-related metal-dependent hydrolase
MFLFAAPIFILNEQFFSLVFPVITPRFVPNCDQELLEGLGDLVKKYDVRVQTHLSECWPEVIKNLLSIFQISYA